MSVRRIDLAAAWPLLAALTICLSACSSSLKYGWTEEEGRPQDGVDPAAMAASNITVRKHIPTHDKSPIDFYYKHCDLDSKSAFTSKTAYFCNEP